MGLKAVILAGGLGSRLAEETTMKPKPMVEIGGHPILWHIMKLYSTHGINDFVICLGYKGYVIKEYFSNYFNNNSDITFDLAKNSMEIHSSRAESWRVTLVDTGEASLTGGRLKRVMRYVQDDEMFCMTYGDGVSDINISAVIEQHKRMERLATVTGMRQPGRFGALSISGNLVNGFKEKPISESGWINGGFFVLSPKVGDYIEGDHTTWEQAPMERLAREGQLGVYTHDGFWLPMDSLRDKNQLEDLWLSGAAPWKTWTA